MDDNILMLLSRLNRSQDGIDFKEYLIKLSKENYDAYKKDHFENDRVHKGYAIAIDGLIKSFETADEILEKRKAAKLADMESTI